MKILAKALQVECDRFNRFASIGQTLQVNPGPLLGGELHTVTVAEPGACVSQASGGQGARVLVAVLGGLGNVPLENVRVGKETTDVH